MGGACQSSPTFMGLERKSLKEPSATTWRMISTVKMAMAVASMTNQDESLERAVIVKKGRDSRQKVTVERKMRDSMKRVHAWATMDDEGSLRKESSRCRHGGMTCVWDKARMNAWMSAGT